MGRSQKVLTSILFHRLPSLRVKFAPFSVFSSGSFDVIRGSRRWLIIAGQENKAFAAQKQKIFDKDGTVGAQVSCDDAILVRLPNLPGGDRNLMLQFLIKYENLYSWRADICAEYSDVGEELIMLTS